MKVLIIERGMFYFTVSDEALPFYVVSKPYKQRRSAVRGFERFQKSIQSAPVALSETALPRFKVEHDALGHGPLSYEYRRTSLAKKGGERFIKRLKKAQVDE